MKILVTPTSFSKDKRSQALDMLEEFADEIIFNPYGRPLTAPEMILLLDNVDGIIAGLDYITEEVINNASKTLKVISRYGVGYERIDIEAASKKGIVVTNTPGVNAESVADLALSLMLSIARGIPTLNSQVKNGEWPRFSGAELYKKTVGILGLGAIGKGVAMRAKGFSMKVLAYDPYIDRAYAEANDIEVCDFEEIISNSDFISLHLPLNEKTKNIINADTILKMKKGAVIINTARGGLIDEDAAYQGLQSGKLGGLGLDAFEKEPPENSPLFELDNVVVTPHTGAHTAEAVCNMGIMSVQNLIDVLSGNKCNHIVNDRV